MPRRSTFEHQHFELRRETAGFAAPIMQHGCRANHQRRFGIFSVALLQPGQPGECLQRFAQAHVVSEYTAQFDLGKVAEEIKTIFLVRPHVGLHGPRHRRDGNTFKILEPLAQSFGTGRIAEALQPFLIQMRDLFQADALRHRNQSIHTQIGHRFMGRLNGGGIQLDPT